MRKKSPFAVTRPPELDTSSRISPTFPRRPTSEQIDTEYTPARVMRLAKYVAAGKKHVRAEQLEEDISITVLAIYTRIDQYKRGATEIPEKFDFYHWLLFRVRADLAAERNREQRSLNGRQIEAMPEDIIDPSSSSTLEQEKVDLKLTLLERLPEYERWLLTEYHVVGRTQQDIADELGISQAALSKKMDRIYRELRWMMGDESRDVNADGLTEAMSK